MLYVVLPVHNRAPVTAGFLSALAQQSHRGFCLILVDDGCTDDTVVIARRKLPADQLIVLVGDGQLWWAGALQMAYQHLAALPAGVDDAVLIINDDVTFEPDFLAKGMAVLTEHPDACIQALGVDQLSGAVDRGAIADTRHLRFRAAMPGETANCLSTRGLLMSAATFVRSGGFHPRWLPHYLSDYEFTLRLQRTGTTLRVDERFTMKISLELTGLSAPSALSLRRFWADTFSNRAKFNPRHWSAFVILACPVWVIPVHLARIWLRFLLALAVAAWPGARALSRS